MKEAIKANLGSITISAAIVFAASTYGFVQSAPFAFFFIGMVTAALFLGFAFWVIVTSNNVTFFSWLLVMVSLGVGLFAIWWGVVGAANLIANSQNLAS